MMEQRPGLLFSLAFLQTIDKATAPARSTDTGSLYVALRMRNVRSPAMAQKR